MATQKYYVTVDEENTTRWYKDAKCKILHRERMARPLSIPAAPRSGTRMAYVIVPMELQLSGPVAPRSGTRAAIYIAQVEPLLNMLMGDKWWFIDGVRLTEAEFNQRVKNV